MSVKKLSRTQQAQAAQFISEHGRPLEQTRYAHFFENGSKEAIFFELARFQNDDGGFGNGLEPDLRLVDSSVLATTVAFQRFRELDASPDHPLVQKACRFLLDTYNADDGFWPMIPDNTGDAPHAPWWSDAASWRRFPDNPRAEIVGYLYDYPDCFPEDLRQQLTKTVVSRLLSLPDDIEMHELMCFVRLSETRTLPDSTRARMLPKLESALNRVVAREPADWDNYGLPPLEAAPSPDARFAPLFENELSLNLDHMIERQAEAGCWTPAWSWEADYPEAWAIARDDWSGVLTLQNLLILRAFGRLE